MDPAEVKNEIIRLAEKKGWTNRQLSEASGVPLGTVASIRSKNNDRFPSLDTAQRLMEVLLDADEGDGDEMRKPPETLTYSELTQAMVSLYERTIANKNKWIRILFVILCAVVVFVFAILVYDLMNPNVGWIQN